MRCAQVRNPMVSVAPSEHLSRLASKDEFLEFQKSAIDRWTDLWDGNDTVISVGVGSSSVAKGSLEVLDTVRQTAGSSAIVREVSGNGAFWMEPWIEVKRPGQFPVLYGPVSQQDVAGVIDGSRDDLAVGVRGDQPVGDIRPLSEHHYFKDQIQLLTRNAGVIEPDSIEDAIARG